MNIDTIISNLHPILLDIVNPTDIDIVNKLIVSIDSIVYKKSANLLIYMKIVYYMNILNVMMILLLILNVILNFQ